MKNILPKLLLSLLRRKLRLLWDGQHRDLIKEAIIYTFPLFQADSPQVVYEASKFLISLINANCATKSAEQNIALCKAWRSSGKPYKVDLALNNIPLLSEYDVTERRKRASIHVERIHIQHFDFLL